MAIKLRCKIKAKHNFKRFEQIEKKLPQVIQQGIEEVLDNIQTEAIRIENGHNQEGIIIDRVDLSTKEIKGRVYTDKNNFPWAIFEHFGTGDFRELPAVGTTKHFIETGGSEWFIPVSKVEKTLRYPIIDINGTQFYLAHGVKSNHFMTDAEFKTRNDNKELIISKINEMFKEVCK